MSSWFFSAIFVSELLSRIWSLDSCGGAKIDAEARGTVKYALKKNKGETPSDSSKIYTGIKAYKMEYLWQKKSDSLFFRCFVFSNAFWWTFGKKKHHPFGYQFYPLIIRMWGAGCCALTSVVPIYPSYFFHGVLDGFQAKKNCLFFGGKSQLEKPKHRDGLIFGDGSFKGLDIMKRAFGSFGAYLDRQKPCRRNTTFRIPKLIRWESESRSGGPTGTRA